jgi:hypothetical protein
VAQAKAAAHSPTSLAAIPQGRGRPDAGQGKWHLAVGRDLPDPEAIGTEDVLVADFRVVNFA